MKLEGFKNCMQKPFIHQIDSPSEFFELAKSIVPSVFAGMYENSYSIVDECARSKTGDFNGCWRDVCKKFEDSDFEDETSLIDGIVDDLRIVDYDEVKWNFAQRLVEGDFVDVEKWMDGSERCWLGYRRISRTKPVIRIFVNFGGNCFRTAEELAMQGAIGVTFAEILESVGYPAEIWAVAYTVRMDRQGNDYVEKIRLKAPNEYCDLGLINFMLGSDGIFRNGMFRIDCKRAMDNGNDVAFGLGQSRNADLKILGLRENEELNAIIIPQIYDRETAIKWLKDILANQEKLYRLTYTGKEEYDRNSSLVKT